jgi:hypothetical protein
MALLSGYEKADSYPDQAWSSGYNLAASEEEIVEVAKRRLDGQS